MPSEPLPTVYLETSVISYLTARTSRDSLIAGRQHVTHRWWDERRRDYKLLVSELVIKEASCGNAAEAAKRNEIIHSLDLLPTTKSSEELAAALIAAGSLPSKAKNDALHASLCAVHGVNFLVTWNMRHLANAVIRRKIEQLFQKSGYVPPVICTPDELLGENFDVYQE